MAKVKIVYGSGGGNTEVVCEKVEQVMRDLGHEVVLLKAKVSEPSDIGEFDLLILASPTYGHGILESYFGEFLEKLRGVDLQGRLCGIIGLGDPKYDDDYHIESVKIIHDFLVEKGAVLVHIPLRISKSPYPLLNTHAGSWAEKVSEKLKVKS
ncbi:flavodoxin domain-containing protein [Candidatus Gracilibacteria bacterium]|nr:flavodoxin domain-containing protein [Candidatus Gracilibacteria bacterium]